MTDTGVPRRPSAKRNWYSNDPERLLEAMSEQQGANGHVGILSFETEKELTEYFEKTGEEIMGFFECREDSRPYNF